MWRKSFVCWFCTDRAILPQFSLNSVLNLLHHTVADLHLVQGDVVLPHRLGVTAERHGCVVVAHARHPRPRHGGAPEVVELELLDLRVGLQVLDDPIFKPVHQPVWHEAPDHLGAAGLAPLQVERPELFGESLEDEVGASQFLQFLVEHGRQPY